MTKRCERHIFKGEAIAFLLIRVNHLCQDKKLLLVMLIPYEIDVTEAAFAQ